MDLGEYDPPRSVHLGVTITADPVPPAGISGHLFWLQIVDDYITYADPSGYHKCANVINGLDSNSFPYAATKKNMLYDTPNRCRWLLAH
jgi:hypothetical protein